jgi:uncharacterized protein
VEPVLHLSIPVRDLAEARRFYLDVLGCAPGRVRAGWADVWFYGLQVTLHERPDRIVTPAESEVRHFGVAVSKPEYDALLARLRREDVTFVREEATDGAGTPREQTKAMILDPTGNAIEVKTYADPWAAFETDAWSQRSRRDRSPS